MEAPDLLDATAAELLDAEESGVELRRRVEVGRLQRLLAWCDLHADDPQARPGAVPASRGGDRLITPGGDGTPGVSQLCFAEFAIAGEAGTIATQHRAGDYLDLRHRLPATYTHVLALRLDLWVAAKIARLSRAVSRERIAIVDAAVAGAVAESPGRILAIAEAAIIEADLEAHRAKIQADAENVGVWSRRPRTGERVETVDAAPATRTVAARISEAGTERLLETLEHLADAIAATDENRDLTTDQLRALALEQLADPATAAALLGQIPGSREPDEPDEPDEPGEVDEADQAGAPRPAAPPLRKRPPRRPATIVVHCHAEVLAGRLDAPVRVEGLGPMLLDQLTALLAGRDLHLQPVLHPTIDLAHTTAVNGYEHPAQVRYRTLLRTTRDVFPHATRTTTSGLDHDHATPYRPPVDGGPPAQTGDHNDAPLTRRDHRAKTHLGYRCAQLGPGVYAWITPHGLGRLVTPRGTHRFRPLYDRHGHGHLIGAHLRLSDFRPG